MREKNKRKQKRQITVSGEQHWRMQITSQIAPHRLRWKFSMAVVVVASRALLPPPSPPQTNKQTNKQTTTSYTVFCRRHSLAFHCLWKIFKVSIPTLHRFRPTEIKSKTQKKCWWANELEMLSIFSFLFCAKVFTASLHFFSFSKRLFSRQFCGSKTFIEGPSKGLSKTFAAHNRIIIGANTREAGGSSTASSSSSK